jgi:uncharacterized protein (TIGR02145 family)
MAENLINNGDEGETFDKYAVRDHVTDMCPIGWHVPTKIEADDLITETGGKEIASKVLRITDEHYTLGTNASGLSLATSYASISMSRVSLWTSAEYTSPNWLGYFCIVLYSDPRKSDIGNAVTLQEDTGNHPVRCLKTN